MFSNKHLVRTLSGLFVVGLSVTLFQNCAKTNESLVAPSTQAEVLTADLVSKSLNSGTTESELLNVAQARQKELLHTLKDNPSEVLRLGLSTESREVLPDSVRPFVEKSAQVEGELTVFAVDGKEHRIEYALIEKSGARHTLHLSRPSLKELKTGQKIRASGLEMTENAATDAEQKHLVVDPLNSGILMLASSNGPSVGSVPGKLGNTYGEQKSLVIRVNFSNAPTAQPLSVSTIASTMNQVNTYYKEVSYNKATVTYTATNYFTIAATNATCDTVVIGQQAAAAALKAGFNVNNYDRILVAYPQNLSCAFAGLATLGGVPSYAFFNGVFDKNTVVHELGHNLGLYHAHSMSCGTTVLGDSCAVEEYGNPIDSMGAGNVVGHFNAYSKDRLGWLEPQNLVTVTDSGTYNLVPYEGTTTSPQALKIFKGMNPTTGEKTFYYLEYRQATGQDLNSLRVSGRVTDNTKGFVVHMGDELYGYNNFILDMTPETYYQFNDAALGLNKVYADPAAGLSMTTRSFSSSGASIAITLAPTACTKNAPEVTTTSSGFSLVDFGSKILFKIKVMNKNSSSCPTENVALSTVVPSGFVAQLDQDSVTLASGQSAEMNLVLTTPTNGTNATYLPTVEARTSTQMGSLQLPVGMTDMAGSPPIATNDLASTAPGQSVTLAASSLVGNDSEPDGNSIYVDNRMGVAKNGTITFNAPSGIVLDITYTPNPGFTGTDRFKYMIRDATGYNVAEVVVTVGATSTPTPTPTATPVPTATPTPVPSPSPTATPVPTATPTPTPVPTATPTATPTPSGDTTPPTVEFTAPLNGGTARERALLTMTANAFDNVKVARVEFYVNGVLTCTDTLASYRCPFALPTGFGLTYRLEAKAIDSANNSTSQVITITSVPLR